MPVNLSSALQYYVWVKMTFYYSSNVTVFPVSLIIPVSTPNSYWCHPQIKFPLKIILNPEPCYVFPFPFIAFSGQSKTGCLWAVIFPVSIISYPWKAWVIMHRLTFFVLFVGEGSTCAPWHTCAEQRTACGSQLPPSTKWVSGIELIFQLRSKSFTHWATLMAPHIIFYM